MTSITQVSSPQATNPKQKFLNHIFESQTLTSKRISMGWYEQVMCLYSHSDIVSYTKCTKMSRCNKEGSPFISRVACMERNIKKTSSNGHKWVMLLKKKIKNYNF